MGLVSSRHISSRLGTTSMSPMKRTRGWASTRPLIFTLTLTSLIDAFSILVIFLLMQTPAGKTDVTLKSGQRLPSATTLTSPDGGISVRLSNGQIFIKEKLIAARDLVKTFVGLRGSGADSLIIQADKTSDFDQISPLVQAAAHSGFETIKFAVLPKRVNPE